MVNDGNKEIESILALFKAEGIDACDFNNCARSLSETCLPTRLTKAYKDKIYPVAKQSAELGCDFEGLIRWMTYHG